MFAFDLSYSNHRFAALIICLPSTLIPKRIADNVTKAALFSLCIFLTVFQYWFSPKRIADNVTKAALFSLCIFLTVFQYWFSPDGNLSASVLWCIWFCRIVGRKFIILEHLFYFLMSVLYNVLLPINRCTGNITNKRHSESMSENRDLTGIFHQKKFLHFL